VPRLRKHSKKQPLRTIQTRILTIQRAQKRSFKRSLKLTRCSVIKIKGEHMMSAVKRVSKSKREEEVNNKTMNMNSLISGLKVNKEEANMNTMKKSMSYYLTTPT
jgi:hypothetical protein